MVFFNRGRLRSIFTGLGPQVGGDDIADVLEDGVRELAPKSEVDSLRLEMRKLFVEFEERVVARLEAKFYRAIFVLAVFFIALYAGAVALLVALLG